ncbi:hypothetical protein FSP39_003736 [Pinctada imbricata]|uniref:Uncharacterized protein n=2 Tax=Pinctada imbricata TaxID=66713 RepID=A0AA88YSU5_PINIB|nr:hypothetical protein FSP39_003736 [Pinctada imbricata]
MAKRKLDMDDLILTGYLHNTTNILTSSSGTTRYFLSTIQTSTNDCKRVVSFCPEKHEEYQRAASMDCAVKLINPKLKPSSQGGIEVHILRQTTLEISSEKPTFKKLEMPPLETDSPELLLATMNKENVRGTINVKLLGFLGEIRQTPTKFGVKARREAVVADRSSTMKITFWGNTTQLVETGKSYRMKNISTRMYNGKITINTLQSTEIEVIPDITNAKENVDFLQDITETIVVDQIKITQNFKCSNTVCNKNITIINNEPTVKCDSCNMKQRVKNLNKVTTTVLNATTETNSKMKYILFQETMESFLALNEKEILINDPDRLEDYILEIEHFLICHADGSDIITKLQNKDTTP